jgi:pimeloyl-ACP methyl ester carboxylesterase
MSFGRPLRTTSMADYIDVNGVHMWYDKRGQGDPLVLMHGGLTDSRDFGGNLDGLASQFRLYLPERRGHGHTADVEGASPTEEEQWKCQQVANITGHEVKLLAGWPSKHSVYRFEPQTAWQMIW